MKLSAGQIESYHRNGHLFPLDVFDTEQVETMLLEFEQARQDALKRGLADEWPILIRTNVHYLLPFVYRAATAPQLLDLVESVLGPDLLLWSAEFFNKGAGTEKIVSWHQDLTYWGLGETDDEITVWLALSDVNVESGCMRFVSGSHRQHILPHRDTFDAGNLLSRGQEVAVDIDEDSAVNVVLKPGQVSMHHGRIFHASGPNRADYDRIGLALRFLTPKVRQLVAKQDYAMLVRGTDSSNNWNHVAPPTQNFAAADLSKHAQIGQEQSVALAEGASQTLHNAY